MLLCIPIVYIASRADAADDNDGRPDTWEDENLLNDDENDIEWTFLVYMPGDDSPYGGCASPLVNDMWETLEKMSWVGCTDNINIVVQFDGTDEVAGPHNHWNMMYGNPSPYGEASTTRRFLLTKDDNPSGAQFGEYDVVEDCYDVTNWDPAETELSHSGTTWETNTGDPDTLDEFLDWGMNTFPSDYYCLVINCHGGAYEGLAVDFRTDYQSSTSTTPDILTLSEISTITPPQNIDLVYLYSCYMSNIETIHAFSGFTDYFVANEDILGMGGNADDDILNYLENNPNITPEQLGKKIIDEYMYWATDSFYSKPYPNDIREHDNISFCLTNIEYLNQNNFFSSFNTFTTSLLNGLSEQFYGPGYENTLTYALNRPYFLAQEYTCTNMDLYYFLMGITEYNFPPQGSSYWTTFIGAVNTMLSLIYNDNNPDNDGTYSQINIGNYGIPFNIKGINIALPEDADEYDGMINNYISTSFHTSTNWGEILEYLFDTMDWELNP